MEPRIEVRKMIVNEQLVRINNTIYDAVISKRVADKVKDEQMSKNAVTILEKCEKMADEYKAILAELEAEEKK